MAAKKRSKAPASKRVHEGGRAPPPAAEAALSEAPVPRGAVLRFGHRDEAQRTIEDPRTILERFAGQSFQPKATKTLSSHTLEALWLAHYQLGQERLRHTRHAPDDQDAIEVADRALAYLLDLFVMSREGGAFRRDEKGEAARRLAKAADVLTNRDSAHTLRARLIDAVRSSKSEIVEDPAERPQRAAFLMFLLGAVHPRLRSGSYIPSSLSSQSVAMLQEFDTAFPGAKVAGVSKLAQAHLLRLKKEPGLADPVFATPFGVVVEALKLYGERKNASDLTIAAYIAWKCDLEELSDEVRAKPGKAFAFVRERYKNAADLIDTRGRPKPKSG